MLGISAWTSFSIGPNTLKNWTCSIFYLNIQLMDIYGLQTFWLSYPWLTEYRLTIQKVKECTIKGCLEYIMITWSLLQVYVQSTKLWIKFLTILSCLSLSLSLSMYIYIHIYKIYMYINTHTHILIHSLPRKSLPIVNTMRMVCGTSF